MQQLWIELEMSCLDIYKHKFLQPIVLPRLQSIRDLQESPQFSRSEPLTTLGLFDQRNHGIPKTPLRFPMGFRNRRLPN